MAAVAGASRHVRARSYPDRRFAGKVALVYPHLNAATRTVRVRIELPNPDHVLLPRHVCRSRDRHRHPSRVVAVPKRGDRQRQPAGRHHRQGRGPFRAARRSSSADAATGYVEIREGVAEGETVVTSANFLIDAESNLKAALKGSGSCGGAAMIARLIAGRPATSCWC